MTNYNINSHENKRKDIKLILPESIMRSQVCSLQGHNPVACLVYQLFLQLTQHSLFLRLSLAQKVEEDEDDMAELQAWTTS